MESVEVIRIEKNNNKIIELLLEAELITEEQLKEVLELQERNGERLNHILVKYNFVSETQLMEVLEFQLGIPFIDLSQIEIPSEVQKAIPYQVINRHNLLPIKIEAKLLYVAMEDPLNFFAIEDVRIATGMEIVPVISYKKSIYEMINRLYGNETSDNAIEEFQKEINHLQEEIASIQSKDSLEVDGAPIVRLVNAIIEQAVTEQSSDIHIEPLENEIRIRYRVDGKLTLAKTIPKLTLSAIVTRIKILADLDIAEKRIPQDGRCDYKLKDRTYNLRVSILPTVNGEKVVMRILDKTNFLVPKDQLGFTEENLVKFDQLLQNPHGIILITGPTGSGKSTTLYTMLSELNEMTDNITTVEDPVEYMIDGLNQVQVNTKAGLSFAGALRSFLRQDPDIIMLGEIRDNETVDVALRAAITGHLVLSTLHTNDAVSSISRLADMGVPSYMIAVALMGVISQRLVRRLCPNCSKPYQPGEHELRYLELPPDEEVTFRKPQGCSVCNNSGFKGRLAVHEILLIDQGIRDLVASNASTNEMVEYAVKQGMSTLRNECIKLLKRGVTSFDEVSEITYKQKVAEDSILC